MTLDQFIQDGVTRLVQLGYPSRAHIVDEIDFNTLYVRVTRRWIGQIRFEPVLDIASVEVDEAQRGQGRFTKLVDRVRDAHPTLHLYVENAMDSRFQKHLERYGFAVVKPRLDPPCYFLPAKGSP